jgi:hypothetical protein
VARDSEANIGIGSRSMAESPFLTHTVPSRQSLRLDGHENRATFNPTRGGDRGNIAL